MAQDGPNMAQDDPRDLSRIPQDTKKKKHIKTIVFNICDRAKTMKQNISFYTIFEILGGLWEALGSPRWPQTDGAFRFASSAGWNCQIQSCPGASLAHKTSKNAYGKP